MDTNTKTKEEIITAKSYWQTVFQGTEENPTVFDPTTQALYKFAEPLLEQATVNSVAQTEHSALHYAMLLYIQADTLVNSRNMAVLSNQIAQTALLVALQDCCYANDFMAYGSHLLYDLKQKGINLGRPVIAAFLAQEGTWSSNRSKSDLLTGNYAAVSIYCAKLQVLCQTLIGTTATLGGSEDALEKIEMHNQINTPEDAIRYYLTEFGIPYLECLGVKNAAEQMDAFCAFLAKSDFYVAPCSTKYHLSRDGGLAEHTIHVLMQMLWLTLPATKQQLGACVLAAIGHDICKIGVYHKNTKSKKFYLAEGEPAPEGVAVKQDNGGSFYWGENYYYEFKDAMPFGHGRKAAYMMMGFFPQLGMDVYAAIDGHMADSGTNPQYLVQFAQYPLALNLHIADALATYLDEAEI